MSQRAPGTTAFASPPADSRILKIIHGWPDRAEDQDRLIARLRAQGFGGVVCNVSFADYLQSGARWEAFRRAVGAARHTGLVLWLYDEKGYPSGTAGGEVLRGHAEWEAEGLLAADLECGPGQVSLAIPPGRLTLAAAFPVAGGTVDLSRPVELRPYLRDGQLSWEAPAGRWHVLLLARSTLFEGTHAEGNLSTPLPYPNLLLAEPTRRFLELTHGRYARQLGPDLGRHFVATFTDEPSLMSLFLRRMPWRPLPWSATLPAAFRERHGYALEPVLPSLVLDTGPAGLRHRHDFWLTVGELVADNFFGQIQRTCQGLGLRSGGHLLAEEGLTSHVALYGNFFACLRRLNAPSIDCLTSVPAEVPWHIARLAASAAELDGRDVVMCETSDHGQVWRASGETRPKRTVTEAEIRGTANRLIVSGVNSLTSYYSFAGLDDAALRRLNEWVGRCCTLMREGHSAADVAVVYPAESLATHFLPAHHWANASPAANRIDVVFRSVLAGLDASQREFTIIDSRTLAEGRVRHGRLMHRDLAWRVVVLPAVDVLPAAAWDRLERLAGQGGLVVAVGARPLSDGGDFPSPPVEQLAVRLFGAPGEGVTISGRRGGGGVYMPAGLELVVPTLIDRWLEPPVRLVTPATGLRAAHRRTSGHELFLVVNQAEKPWQGRLAFAARGAGQWLDPASGAFHPVDDPSAVELKLGPFGAAGVSFDAPRERRGGQLRVEDLPCVTVQPLRLGDPVVSRGEWVRDHFRHEDPSRFGPSAAWRAEATLARGGVDTFLFVRFAAPDALDLRDQTGVAFDVEVPAGQHPATQLLVVLKEADGGEFLATTPCSLAAADRMRLALAFSQFNLTPWAVDRDGVLDPTRISEIRIGWGGYHGREGEQLSFVTSAPHAARVK